MYDQNKLIEILTTSEYRCLDANGKCFPPSNSMYEKISKKMMEVDTHISPKHIYTILNTDRRGIRSLLLEAFGLKNNVAHDESSKSNFSENSFECQNKLDDCKMYDDKIFKLIISEKSWNDIKPVARQYNKRRYLKLKPGEWTNVLAEKIWDQTKIPCAFTFKNATVFASHNAKYFVRFHAICKECKATLRGKMIKKPQDGQDAIFDCVLFGFNNQIKHIKKRQLKGSLRQKIAGHLVDAKKQATIWRNEEARKIMNFGDQEPPILFSPHVLRKAKQNELDNRLDVVDCDPIRNLQIYKYVKRPGSIYGIGLDPFYIMYWSKEQITMYKMINRLKNTYFTMDATGSIAKKLPMPDGTKSPHLFLYQCVIVPEDKRGIPVFQMISAKQDAALLTYFLLEIRRAGATVPSVAVTDFSRAILVALARAFADCADLKHYLQCCYDVVLLNKETALPGCYLRLDVSHVIKIISNWECLRHLPNKVQQFYLRCIAQAYKMQCMEELNSFLTSLLTVALSEDVGHVDGASVPAETCLQDTNNCIKNVHVEDCNASTDIISVDDFSNSEDTPLSWQEWSNSLYTKANSLALQSHNGSVVNAFYNPTAAMKIKSLMQNLPLWTGIMRPYFKSGTEISTSSSVESLFAEYKTRLFKNSIPMRVDKFVASHLDYLDGRLRLHYAANASPTEPELKIAPTQGQIETHDQLSEFSDNSSYHNLTPNSYDNIVTDSSGNNSIHNIQDDSHNIQAHSRVSDSLSSPSNECPLNFQENWMGLINKNTNKTGGIKKKSYLDKCPEWDCVESTDTIFIPIIKNGNCCQPVTLHGKTIMVRNTCAFDALLHITAHIIGMDAEYKLNIQDIDDCFLQLAKKIVLQGKITKNEYSARALFLINTSLFKTYKYTRRFETLDAMCNAAHLAEYTFASLPSLHRSKKCQMCNYSNERNFTAISINVNILLQKGLQYIQEAINDAIATTQHCVKCNNSYTVSEKYSPQILIDTSVLTDDNYLKDMGLQVTTYTVESIAKNITIGNKKYTLRGVVNYLKQASHYTALLYTNVSWYEYDDLKSKRQQVSPQKYIILPHVLLYAQTK